MGEIGRRKKGGRLVGGRRSARKMEGVRNVLKMSELNKSVKLELNIGVLSHLTNSLCVRSLVRL